MLEPSLAIAQTLQQRHIGEVRTLGDVAAGVRDSIACGAIFDAVKHLVLCRIERRPPRLDMTVYPYLPDLLRLPPSDRRPTLA